MADACVDFRSLLEQKEREILGTHERQVSLLQRRYNLALLDSRDVELEEYDALLASVEGSLKEKELALEDVERAILKANAENMQERERDKVCKETMNHKICNLEKELGSLRLQNEEKLRKQEDRFESIKSALKKQVLESEKKIHEMKNAEADNLKNIEEQVRISQWESNVLKVRLQDTELKLMKLEAHFKTAIDEKSRKFQELCLEITKLKTEEGNLRQCYDENLKKMRNDATAADKEQIKCILQEVEKVNELTIRLSNVQSRFDSFKNTMTERLLVFSGKVQCLEQEVRDLKDCESTSIQRMESKYLESMRRHDLCLQRKLRQATNLEAENRHLQESLSELKDENERIQKVVATLRLEMESLQEATAEENQKTNSESSEKEIEMQTAKDFQEELQVLKSKISNMSIKLDGIQVNAPANKKKIGNFRGSTRMAHKPDDLMFSDEHMSSRLAEMEQRQAVLKTQLEATVANAARIADERDILMELNNSLHADLNRTVQCSCASQHRHIIDDNRQLDGACCHESNGLNRGIGQNNLMIQGNGGPQ